MDYDLALSNVPNVANSTRRLKWFDYNMFTKDELKIIGNLCETMKHWRRHNPEVTFPDSLYEQLENIQDKCTKAIQVYGKSV